MSSYPSQQNKIWGPSSVDYGTEVLLREGDLYYNNSTGKYRQCTNPVGPVWEDVAGGSSNFVVFQPGGTAGGIVYTTWATLNAAALAIVASSGTVYVVIDTTYGAAQVPAGAYDFSSWRFMGVFPGLKTTLTFMSGATWTMTAYAGPTFEMTDLAFELDAGSTTSAISSPVGASGSLKIVMRNSSLLGLVGDSFINGKANGGGSQFNVQIIAYGSSVLDAYALTLDDTDPGSGSNGEFDLYDRSFMETTTVSGPGGFLTLHQWSRAAAIVSQSGFSGTTSYDGQATPHNWPLNEQQLGTTELHIGSIYIYASSILRSISKAMLGGAIPADTGILKLRRFTGGTLIATWTAAGTLQDIALGGADIIIANDDWYELYLVAGGAAETAIIKGLRLFIHEPGAVS